MSGTLAGSDGDGKTGRENKAKPGSSTSQKDRRERCIAFPGVFRERHRDKKVSGTRMVFVGGRYRLVLEGCSTTGDSGAGFERTD